MNRTFFVACCCFPPCWLAADAALAAPPRAMQRFLTDLVLSNMPREYEKAKNWGHTKEIVSGLDVRRDGLRIITKRRRKRVNHGTWRKYHVRLVNAEKEFHIRYQPLDTPHGDDRFHLYLAARLYATGRQQHWNRGIKLASISAAAEAWVHLRLTCQLNLKIHADGFSSRASVRPKVHAVDLQLRGFRLHRLGNLEGPLAEELGRNLRGFVREKLEEQEPKLAEKINAKIEKKKEILTFSLADALQSDWLPLGGDRTGKK